MKKLTKALIDMGLQHWVSISISILVLYTGRNIYYLIYKKDRLKDYRIMSMITFLVVMCAPIYNWYVSLIQENYLSALELVLLITACLSARVSIMIARNIRYPGGACLGGDKQLSFSTTLLLWFLFLDFYADLISEGIGAVVFVPYVAYFIYLALYYRGMEDVKPNI